MNQPTKNNDLYMKARGVFDRTELERIDGTIRPDTASVFSVFNVFQQLAAVSYGKSYDPLAILDLESGNECAQHSAKLAFDWCFANQDYQDADIWSDLGAMYYYGTGTDKNIEQALYWLRKAADHGYALAQFNLGWIYEANDGVPYNFEESARWYLLAAENGNADAQAQMGMMYTSGEGVPKDNEKAKYWFTLSDAQNIADAKANRAVIKELGCRVLMNNAKVHRNNKKLRKNDSKIYAQLTLNL